MKLIALKDINWSIAPHLPPLRVKKDGSFEIEDEEIAAKMITKGYAVKGKADKPAKPETKINKGADENKMQNTSEENKEEGKEEDQSIVKLIEQLSAMTKDELVIFAKENDIKVDVSDTKKEVFDSILNIVNPKK